MASRRTKLIRVGVTAAIVGIVAYAAHLLIPREPTYRGQPFSYWVDRLDPTITSTTSLSYGGGIRDFTATHPVPLILFRLGTNGVSAAMQQQSQAESQTASQAVEVIGMNCLQTLVTRLGTRQFPLKRKLEQWAVTLKVMKPPDLTVDQRRRQALTAIRQLGERARPIVPQITILSNHSDTNISAVARCALEGIEADEKGKRRIPLRGIL